jgi:hypothetical protein
MDTGQQLCKLIKEFYEDQKKSLVFSWSRQLHDMNILIENKEKEIVDPMLRFLDFQKNITKEIVQSTVLPSIGHPLQKELIQGTDNSMSIEKEIISSQKPKNRNKYESSKKVLLEQEEKKKDSSDKARDNVENHPKKVIDSEALESWTKESLRLLSTKVKSSFFLDSMKNHEERAKLIGIEPDNNLLKQLQDEVRRIEGMKKWLSHVMRTMAHLKTETQNLKNIRFSMKLGFEEIDKSFDLIKSKILQYYDEKPIYSEIQFKLSFIREYGLSYERNIEMFIESELKKAKREDAEKTIVIKEEEDMIKIILLPHQSDAFVANFESYIEHKKIHEKVVLISNMISKQRPKESYIEKFMKGQVQSSEALEFFPLEYIIELCHLSKDIKWRYKKTFLDMEDKVSKAEKFRERVIDMKTSSCTDLRIWDQLLSEAHNCCFSFPELEECAKMYQKIASHMFFDEKSLQQVETIQLNSSSQEGDMEIESMIQKDHEKNIYQLYRELSHLLEDFSIQLISFQTHQVFYDQFCTLRNRLYDILNILRDRFDQGNQEFSEAENENLRILNTMCRSLEDMTILFKKVCVQSEQNAIQKSIHLIQIIIKKTLKKDLFEELKWIEKAPLFFWCCVCFIVLRNAERGLFFDVSVWIEMQQFEKLIKKKGELSLWFTDEIFSLRNDFSQEIQTQIELNNKLNVVRFVLQKKNKKAKLRITPKIEFKVWNSIYSSLKRKAKFVHATLAKKMLFIQRKYSVLKHEIKMYQTSCSDEQSVIDTILGIQKEIKNLPIIIEDIPQQLSCCLAILGTWNLTSKKITHKRYERIWFSIFSVKIEDMKNKCVRSCFIFLGFQFLEYIFKMIKTDDLTPRLLNDLEAFFCIIREHKLPFLDEALNLLERNGLKLVENSESKILPKKEKVIILIQPENQFKLQAENVLASWKINDDKFKQKFLISLQTYLDEQPYQEQQMLKQRILTFLTNMQSETLLQYLLQKKINQLSRREIAKLVCINSEALNSINSHAHISDTYFQDFLSK